MNLNEDNRDARINTALNESLGLTLEDRLINKYNEINTDSVGSHNGGEDTHMDGQAEETFAYNGELEEVYSDEQILVGPIRGVSEVFENTVHRYCIWHIFTKLPMRLKYELALRDKYEKELATEYQSRYTKIRCESQFSWEVQLQAAFTRRIFVIFQYELKRLFHFDLSIVDNEPVVDRVEKYDIINTSIKNDFYGNQFVFRVKHTLDDEYFEYICKSFELRGIVCCHILKVMSHKKTKLFNETYVLTRWRKGVVRHHLEKFFLGGYPHMTDEYKKYKELMSKIMMEYHKMEEEEKEEAEVQGDDAIPKEQEMRLRTTGQAINDLSHQIDTLRNQVNETMELLLDHIQWVQCENQRMMHGILLILSNADEFNSPSGFLAQDDD
ncbi:hypothetical protein RND71_003700 [Anisodus tanguticus]|uniref:Protein FAR1-RELATED SEQUENCE n=1 Tax=Anisodus tanguticus TaxID=243964 RepID=A0AAE1SWX7_9SOLA|nr:hypothetical protein RND71_003700 [Anisodus tanguticus]